MFAETYNGSTNCSMKEFFGQIGPKVEDRRGTWWKVRLGDVSFVFASFVNNVDRALVIEADALPDSRDHIQRTGHV